jgi:predicted DNA-binding transcriptional regulator YafY
MPESISFGRYAPATRLVILALALAESRGGLTLDEMAEMLGVSRRTAERLRNKVGDISSGGLVSVDDGQHKRWTIPSRTMGALAVPSLDELTELRIAIADRRREGLASAADKLESIALKLEAAIPRGTLRRYGPDIDALLEASGSVARPGPRVIVNPGVMTALRRCILENRNVALSYRKRGTGEITTPILSPLGMISGSRGYLVAKKHGETDNDLRVYAISNILAAAPLDEQFDRDANFDLQDFAARSFGVFWDGELFDVEWRFSAAVASDARNFQVHPSQTVRDEPDGSVTVAFRASGLTEMAWHLFRWGSNVTVVKPEVLKRRFHECLAAAAANYTPSEA